jgi:hypothetical protein
VENARSTPDNRDAGFLTRHSRSRTIMQEIVRTFDPRRHL